VKKGVVQQNTSDERTKFIVQRNEKIIVFLKRMIKNLTILNP